MQDTQANGSDPADGNEIDPRGTSRFAGVGSFTPGDPPLFSEAITASAPRAPRFLFAYGALPVIGKLRSGPDGAELRLQVVVGRLPYSVESRDQREKMLKLIRTFPAELSESLVIGQDQSICVNVTAPLPGAPTPASLVTELVVRLSRLDPVLRSLADVLPDLAPALDASPFAQA
jgi:hypothetical protein